MSSFLTEINALKPGNVSRYAEGHGMTVNDFIVSAELATPILCNQGLSIGERILKCIKAIQAQVKCNTNLGMVLLFAPLIKAVETWNTKNTAALQKKLIMELEMLDEKETNRVFEAIRLANPGGLGQADKYDVNLPAGCRLLEAMAEVQQRDYIARQYVTGFHDVFVTGLGCIKIFTRRWNSVEWATVACYLTFLADFPDTHIQRKSGGQVAEQTRKRAIPIAEKFKKNEKPDNAISALLEFDKELKDSNINPGTSADLTAASLLLYELTK
ncbi:MAG: triphosphoribosyl-dephospho-CoA synthase [Gammaproteobacteria bacterium]|nr:triphosphoribosyl-dephospho-CoA synthase [Gammaproteobacteria bacterium]